MKEYKIEYLWAEDNAGAKFQHNYMLGYKAKNRTEALKKVLADWSGSFQVKVTAIYRVGVRQKGERDFEKVFVPKKNNKKNLIAD